MKRALLVLAVVALATVVAPTGPAGAGGPAGQVTLVHAATYDAGQNFPVTVCVDDEVLIPEFNTTEIEGPLALPPGSYDVEIFAVQADCSGEPVIGGTLELEEGDDVTAVAYIGTEGPDLAVLTNDTDCVAAGSGRVTARHAAAAGAVDVRASGAPVLTNIPQGGQASIDVPAAEYPDVDVVATGTSDVILAIGTITVTANENLVAYVYGGGDGDVGVFTDTIALEACVEPTTPPTTAAPGATAAAARPRFTG